MKIFSKDWWKGQMKVDGMKMLQVFQIAYGVWLLLVIIKEFWVGNPAVGGAYIIVLMWYLFYLMQVWMYQETRDLLNKVMKMWGADVDDYTKLHKAYMASRELNNRYEARIKKYESETEAKKAE